MLRKKVKNMFYNIHDIIKLESLDEICELEYFKTDDNLNNIDLYVGNSPSDITYRDLLCSLSINLNGNSYLKASKLLWASRHVLYVNLVEPTLRLLLITKGYTLLHIACLEIDGKGIMISAPPDTGKTSCILQCLKKSNEKKLGISLLSDDMIIASDNGNILSYPKPFTISSHTLDAVFGMNPGIWYKFRSRIHSKGGRGIYKAMGDIEGMPIMSINAIAQIIFKPPKLYPNRLMSINIVEKTRPDKLFFLSKDFDGEKKISREEALKLILTNTDNAYITPPYDRIFPKLNVGGRIYRELIDTEIKMASNLVGNIEPIVIGRKDFSWYEYILENL